MSDYSVDETTGELAVIEQNSALAPQDIVKAGASFATNVSLDTIEDRLDVLDAMSNPLPLSEHAGVEIELAGCIAQETQFRDNNQQLVDGVAVYLLDKNGTSYISVSSGVASSVQRMVGLMGEDPKGWPEGFIVKPVKKNIKGGKTTWSFEYPRKPRKK